MSLSPTKREILETMLLLDKAERAMTIAKQVGKEFPSVMMHIIGLTRMGYVASPEKGLYTLTEKAKKTLGIPEINEENAKKALADMPQNQSFHFYASIGKPLSLDAHSLQDFRDKILQVNLESIKFHEDREELRSRLHNMIENRCIVLANIAAHSVLA
jgi:DNA-binding transcriptional ArsR family regulator